MEIKKDGNKIDIYGNVKSISHVEDIKKCIEECIKQGNDITVRFIDSVTLVSSLIGYFHVLIVKENASVKLEVSDAGLYELLEDLNLIDLLNVTKSAIES
jgi:hypothetical protein